MAKEKSKKNQKGITLIALIITIIVMLILVGVTVNVVLKGGLFNTADDATKRTEKHSIYDQIVGAMELTDNGNVNVKGTYDAVVDMFGENKVKPTSPTTIDESTTEVTFTVEGKKGTYTYKIASKAIEIEKVKTQQEIDFDRLSLKVQEIKGTNDAIDIERLDNNLPEEFEGENGVYTSLSGNTFSVDSEGTIVYIGNTGVRERWVDNGDGTYTKGDVTVTRGVTTFTNAQVLEILGIEQTDGTYNGDWGVVGVEKGKLKLVSTEIVKYDVIVGSKDDSLYKKDENGNTTKELIDELVEQYVDDDVGGGKVMLSIKNMTNSFDEKVKKATGIQSARSVRIQDIYDVVGEENINKGSDFGKAYNYYFNNSFVWSKYQTGTNELGEIEWSNPNLTGYDDILIFDENETLVKISENYPNSVILKNTAYSYTFSEEQAGALGFYVKGLYNLPEYGVTCSNAKVEYKLARMSSTLSFDISVKSTNSSGSDRKCDIKAIIWI